jgi:HEAT repeat protein
MAEALSPYRLGKARELYNVFNVFNSLSWTFLVGSIITLFAMRLHASATFLGLISALLYVSFFFLPLGKLLVRHFPIVRIFSIAWTGRAVSMFAVVLAPFAAGAGHRDLALGLTVLGVALFHIIRGIGMIGNNPILSSLSEGPDRGSYMTQIQIINSATGMFSSFAVAMLLGRDPPLFLYAVILAMGIIAGVTGGIMVKGIPEPPVEERGDKIRFISVFKEALEQPGIKLFVGILFFVALVSGVSRAFLVVYSREVFLQSDGMVSLYAVFGGLGNLMIGLLIKFFVDRIGAKPIFIICIFTGLASMIPIVLFPRMGLDNITTGILFLSLIFFVMNFGFLGAEGIAQTYFLGLIPLRLMLDMGVLYFFIFGVAGAGGSFAAGLLLDTLSAAGLSSFAAFKILYAALVVFTILVLVLQRKLVPLGALPFRGALEVIFSFRDLRAIALLDKLNKTSDSSEEQQILEALHDTPSRLAVKGLLVRARSPRLAVRMESLRAMETLKDLTGDAEQALMEDLINNPYTTAYISARILGNHGAFSAIPLLRELAVSDDYMLAGEAMIALARLNDEAFRPQIEELILKTRNPRLKIMGVEAFGIYGSRNSLSVLLDILKSSNPPPYLRDEVILAMASILDTQNLFYPMLVRFLENQSLASALAMDEAESAFEYYHSNLGNRWFFLKKKNLALISNHAKNIQPAVSAYIREKNGAALSRWILELPDEQCSTVVKVVLSEAALDDDLSSLTRLQLLIIHWAAHVLRKWVLKLKQG